MVDSIKCWCGGDMIEVDRFGEHTDLEESFPYKSLECQSCFRETQDDKQIEDAKASLSAKLAEEGRRDFDEEAVITVTRYLNRGMLVPEEFANKEVRELSMDMDHHNFQHVFVRTEDNGRVSLGWQDYHDGMTVRLDAKQESELLATLLERQKLHECNTDVTEESQV